MLTIDCEGQGHPSKRMVMVWRRAVAREREMKWLNSRHILKVEPTDFADRFKVRMRERKVKDNSKILGLSNYEDGVAINSDVEICE